MTKTKTYHAVLEAAEEGGFVVHVPAFEGCHTQGETLEAALANAREAIELNVEHMVAMGLPLPKPVLTLVAHVEVEIPEAVEMTAAERQLVEDEDDEEISPELEAEILESLEDVRAGNGIPHEQMMEEAYGPNWREIQASWLAQ